MMTQFTTILASILYFLAFWLVIDSARKANTPSNTYLLLTVPAAILHGYTLYSIWWPLGGITLGFFEALSVESLFIVIFYLLTMHNKTTRQLGVLILPAASLTVLGSSFGHASYPASSYLTWQLEVHAILALLAYGLLSMAAAQAILLSVQEYILRHPKYLKLLRLMPSLTQMESALFKLVRAGFYLLTLTLITGAFFVENLFSQHLAHKTILSILSWIVFGYLLSARKRFGWRGRVAIKWTLTGMLFLILAYFGSKMVLEIILKTH